MTDITELALLVSKAKASVFTLEYISQFEPADIDSDDVDLRFEVDGRDTGTNVSIVDECGQAARVIGALVEALEKAQQEADELLKFKEVITSATEALKAGEPLNLESLFKGELASAMFAMMFAGEFVRSGATNYLELLYDVPEFGEMTVTLQKVEGKTPGQRIAELESFRTAYMEWSDKTDWVNTDRRFGVVKPLGKHRADVLKAYIEHLESRTITVKLPSLIPEMFNGDVMFGYRKAQKEAVEFCAAAGIKLEAE